MKLGLWFSEANYPTNPPIRAWRCFELVHRHKDTSILYNEKGVYSCLISPMSPGGDLYPNQVLFAECNHYEHNAPDFNCTCGFYAFKKRKDARGYLPNAMMAEVLLGGKIIETELGYRAEQMIIVKLYPTKKVRNNMYI